MARQTQTILVCDGCSKELVETPGSSRVTIDVKGDGEGNLRTGPLRKVDFCDDCTAKLPDGIERKRPPAREPKKK